VDARQRRALLAVDGDGRQPGGFGELARSAGSRPISKEVTVFDPAYPPAHGCPIGLRDHRDGAGVNAFDAQSSHKGTPLDLLLQPDAPGAGGNGVR